MIEILARAFREAANAALPPIMRELHMAGQARGLGTLAMTMADIEREKLVYSVLSAIASAFELAAKEESEESR